MKSDRVANFLIASILLTLISGGIKYYNVTEKIRTTTLVTHTYDVIQESSELLNLLLEVEASQRGYILTLDSSYLNPYLSSMPQIDNKVNTLLTLTADNPRQTTVINQRIKPLVNLKKKELQDVFEQFKQKHLTGAIAYIKSDSGNVTMDELRVSIAALTRHEEELLEKRNSRLRKIYAVNDTIHYASFVLICIISGLALKTLLDKEKKNKELLAALRESNKNLEIKVHERTVELEKKSQLTDKLNRDLQDNFEELQSFYEALHVSNEKSEDTLREIRDLYDNAPSGYHSLNADGLIVRMNQTELDWLGYTREEVVGKLKVTEILLPEDHEKYHKRFATFLEQGYIRDQEHTFVRKDGSTFQILLNATARCDEQGNFVMSRGIVTDITGRKKIEQRLIETNERLIHLNDEKNHFLGVTIHDLKSPLNRVIGLIDLVYQQGTDKFNPKQREFFQLIREACINMQTLVVNLLDLNRIEQGFNTVNAESVELSPFLERIVQMFQGHAMKKGITLSLEHHQSEKLVRTDPLLLSRILENLISNAIKFSPPNKQVWVRAIHSETNVKIEVQDQGLGISAAEQPLLFKKFQRLSNRPTGGENSTGLGLSIVMELVTALKGMISVESDGKNGSKFIVELPLNI
ncbi:MAG TPA: CHASE3 domain-containing protein [Chryseolinea sp.]|nr:CHASE3 domain-containing protein [Chryseolinea sp.]